MFVSTFVLLTFFSGLIRLFCIARVISCLFYFFERGQIIKSLIFKN